MHRDYEGDVPEGGFVVIRAVPQKYSSAWWGWLLSATLIFGVIAASVLWLIGFVPGLTFVLLVALAACLGDIAVALSLDAVNPTRVLVGPGDRKRHDSQVRDIAVVHASFDAGNEGIVLVRGEMWRARCQSSVEPPAIGDALNIVGRDGLILVVEHPRNDL